MDLFFPCPPYWKKQKLFQSLFFRFPIVSFAFLSFSPFMCAHCDANAPSLVISVVSVRHRKRERERLIDYIPGSSSSPRLWRQTVARRRRIASGASGRRAWSRAGCWRRKCRRPTAGRLASKNTSTTTLTPLHRKKKRQSIISSVTNLPVRDVPWCWDPCRRRWRACGGIASPCVSRSRERRSSRNPVGDPMNSLRWPIRVDPIWRE